MDNESAAITTYNRVRIRITPSLLNCHKKCSRPTLEENSVLSLWYMKLETSLACMAGVERGTLYTRARTPLIPPLSTPAMQAKTSYVLLLSFSTISLKLLP